jgi:hypothetical protein
MADRRTVAEGAFTAPVLRRLAEAEGVDMPIVAAVDDLLAGAPTSMRCSERLLSRPRVPKGPRNPRRCPSSPSRRSAWDRAAACRPTGGGAGSAGSGSGTGGDLLR